MARQLVSSNSPLEPAIGFSRAVRVGRHLAVAGTAPIGPDGRTACPGDVYGQTRACLEIARRAVEEAGFGLKDVIRTRIMLVEVDRWREAAKAHGELFAEVRPACTFVGVCRFIDPDWLVEVELDCIEAEA